MVLGVLLLPRRNAFNIVRLAHASQYNSFQLAAYALPGARRPKLNIMLMLTEYNRYLLSDLSKV
jgi:hypothetical protein